MCLGHESSGIIARLGSNLAAAAAEAEQAVAQLGTTGAKAVVGKAVLKLGQKVTLEPGVTCRMCHDCRGGQYQVCILGSSKRKNDLHRV
jgi:D-xylulose reductase